VGEKTRFPAGTDAVFFVPSQNLYDDLLWSYHRSNHYYRYPRSQEDAISP